MAKILLVEDDLMMQRLYQRAFSLAGIEMIVAQDGEEGLEKIQELSPDLVLLDIMMPKMNGLQVLKKLKIDSKTSKIPVVMLTNIASGTLQSAEEAVRRGADSYIIKSDCEPKKVVSIAIEILEKPNQYKVNGESQTR